MSGLFWSTVQTDPAFSVPENTLFGNHPRDEIKTTVDEIKTDPCVFVFDFVWTPETQMMMSSPPHVLGDVRVALIY